MKVRRNTKVSFDIRILKGLPVTVSAVVNPAEPEVGLMTCQIDDVEITHVNGKKVNAKFSDTLLAKADYDQILEDINDHPDWRE